MLQDLSKSLLATDEDLVENADEARRSLRSYVRLAWPVIDPSPFIDNWHLGAVSEFLEALTSGEIKKLLINMPPGMAKSLMVSVFWPTWEWISHPEERYIYSAFGQALSMRDTKRSRDLIKSRFYQANYGDSFRLSGDQNQKTRYENTEGGFRLATSVGGGATGERGRTLVLDDPHKLEDYYHPEQMAAAVQHKNEVLGTRGVGERTRKVIMMQRVGPTDVSADVLEKMEQGGEHYEVLALPMRHEPSVQLDLMKYNELDWSDPREEHGELLHPDLYGEKEVSDQELNLAERVPLVLQQRGVSAGGTIFSREWFSPGTRSRVRFVIEEGAVMNRVFERYVFFDTAFEDKDSSSYTGCVVLEVMAGTYMVNVRHVSRERVHFPDLLDHIKDVATAWNHDGLLVEVIIENRASGISAVQTLKRTAPGWLADRIVAFAPPGSKDEKCRQAAIYCKLGLVAIPFPSVNAEWLTWFLEEDLFKVPAAKFRDASDAFALGILYLENYLSEARELLEAA